MRTRWVIVLGTVALVLALIVGLAFAAPRGRSGGTWWDEMHGSAWMRQMHAQMPADLQAQCDAMHGQMDEWMDEQMGGGGMMGGG